MPNHTSVDLTRTRKAMSRLQPIEREILVLSAGERLSNDEIAVRLGLTPEAVERHLADALVRLDREMERRDRPGRRSR